MTSGGLGQASLIIPSAQRVEKVMRTLLRLRDKNPATSALLLLPEDYQSSEAVKTFLHAYCQRGEVYRYGKLFKRSATAEYMHLNQAVTECWFDGESTHLSALTEGQRRQLESLLDEFKENIGDVFDATKQPKVPYIRLPVKANYKPASQAPFKKNPKMRKLVIDFDFVQDLVEKGLISRCTDTEAVFVCNPLTLPKGDDRYRFVCTFKDLNDNLIKDPYGMRTLDAVMASLEGNWQLLVHYH